MQNQTLSNRLYRIPGLIFIFSSLSYLAWLFVHLNTNALALGLLFFISQTFIFITAIISIVNHWSMKFRTDRPKLPENLPPIAVIVPTYKEPMKVLKKTLKSILEINYRGKVIIVLSNDYNTKAQVQKIEKMMVSLSRHWNENIKKLRETDDSYANAKRDLHLIHTQPHKDAKAGNLNQASGFLRKYYPEIDLVLTQDADEIVHPEILDAVIGYFSEPNIAFVQTIKHSKTAKGDPFGNKDYMWYLRSAPAREATESMFACGSGVVWRLSAVESINGFATWNLVEDLTTSYNLVSNGWKSRYHFEQLSEGLAPEDLANFIKQRGTWALDNLRIFFWDNPVFKKGLSFRQRLGFIEPSLFYLNGVFSVLLILATSFSLLFEKWPTTASAYDHAIYLLPSFMSLEAYFLLLAGDMPQKRIRQFWAGLSPVFIVAAAKAVFYGPNKKPKYKVTDKKDTYGNYLSLVAPQLMLIGLLLSGVVKTLLSTRIYSSFDWAVFFWGLYQATFYIQIIKVSMWKWTPQLLTSEFSKNFSFGAQTSVSLSYAPDSA